MTKKRHLPVKIFSFQKHQHFSLFRDQEREKEEERKNRERKYRKENLIFLKWGKKDEVDRTHWKLDYQCILFIFEWVLHPFEDQKFIKREREIMGPMSKRERTWIWEREINSSCFTNLFPFLFLILSLFQCHLFFPFSKIKQERKSRMKNKNNLVRRWEGKKNKNEKVFKKTQKGEKLFSFKFIISRKIEEIMKPLESTQSLHPLSLSLKKKCLNLWNKGEGEVWKKGVKKENIKNDY